MIYSQDRKIGIRAIEKSDLSTIQKWRNNESLRQYFREYRDLSMAQEENWHSGLLTDNRFEMFIITDCELDKEIGVTGLTYIDWVNSHADVHFYIGDRGVWIDDKYAPTAIKIILDYGFNTLNLNKLWAEIYQLDAGKLQFFRSLGFQIDASLREHYFHKGKYHTSHILSLLRSEYD